MINFIALVAVIASAQDFNTVPFGAGSIDAANELLAGLTPRDAFSASEECGMVDIKTIRPFTREEAVSILRPCFESLSLAYGAEVKLAADNKGLAIVLDAGVTLTSPLRRDLGRALSNRDHQLLGHPVALRRESESILRPSSLQDAFDACPKPMVLRKIERSEDFLKHYGGCFDKTLELRPSPAHRYGLMVRGRGDVESLNGVLRLIAANGEVELMVMAYGETVALP